MLEVVDINSNDRQDHVATQFEDQHQISNQQSAISRASKLASKPRQASSIGVRYVSVGKKVTRRLLEEYRPFVRLKMSDINN